MCTFLPLTSQSILESPSIFLALKAHEGISFIIVEGYAQREKKEEPCASTCCSS